MQKKAVEQFSEEIQRLTRAKQDAFVSEAYLLSLGKVINLFCTLDELKNIKASMKNDTALYKRSVPRVVALHCTAQTSVTSHALKHSCELN